MRRYSTIALLFLLTFVLSEAINTKNKDKKLGDTNKNNKKNDIDENLDDYDVNKLFDVKEFVNFYLKSHTFKNKDTLDKDEFLKLFVYVCQRGALKNDDSYNIRKLGSVMLKKHGTPVKIENIMKYFDLYEMTITYDEMINGQIQADL